MAAFTGTAFSYVRVNPISFYFKKRKYGLERGFAIVLTLLHFLPRLLKEPKISDNYTRLTGKAPTTIAEFIIREKDELTTPRQNL